MKNENEPQNPTVRRRKLLGWISLGVIILLIGGITWVVCDWLLTFSTQDFRAYIRSFGFGGRFILLGLQILQVFIALIPGELLETAAGYIYGPLQGTLLCYLGVVIASALIFLFTRRFQKRFSEIFVSAEKINELRFLNTETKQRRLDKVMALQQGISLAYNQKRIGTVTEALIEQVSGDIAYGRTYAEAPEVDGTIMFSLKNKGLKPGDFTMVRITGAGPYDMEGEEI